MLEFLVRGVRGPRFMLQARAWRHTDLVTCCWALLGAWLWSVPISGAGELLQLYNELGMPRSTALCAMGISRWLECAAREGSLPDASASHGAALPQPPPASFHKNVKHMTRTPQVLAHLMDISYDSLRQIRRCSGQDARSGALAL